MPCNYVHSYMGYTNDSVSPDCIADLEAQMKFLGPLKVQMMLNDEEFDQSKFGEEAIKQQSKIVYQ